MASSLIDSNWYRAEFALPRGADPVRHYFETGWRQGHDPNAWFDVSWYISQNPEAEAVEPLVHFVSVGASAGQNPHPFFDIRWYAKQYLGGAPPSAEALAHFMNIGLTAGAVPHPRLDTAAIRTRLLATQPAERSAFLKRLQDVISHALAGGGRIVPTGPGDLWALVLAGDVPGGASPVLLISAPGERSSDRAEAAASALPPDEYAIFAVAVNRSAIELRNRLSGNAFFLQFRLPEERGALGTALAHLRCRRAAVVDPEMAAASIIRTIRSAGVPVFVRARPASSDEPTYEGQGSND